MLNLADVGRSQTDGEHDMNLNAANVLGALPASYASLSSLSSLIDTNPNNAPSNQGMSPAERRNVSPPASTTNPNVPKQAPRQLTNWFQPILWTLIDETAEKLGFSKPAGIARHLKTTVSPRLFSRLGERQIRKWINDEKTGWKQTVLEKVTRQEVLAHVQAGLITVSSANGAPNVSGSSVDAFDARARGSTSGPPARGTTRKTRSMSLDNSHFGLPGHTIHNTVGSNAHETLVDIHEEEARRKRRRIEGLQG
ncbi:hypothetical protein QFC22_000005 [Naganishia vaughanmartiniae]|uniref:Uncharacterized protein n=1 Tax=Naganishia vaughanmartiniae TaxID=1424756 RepID=A0ACC2XP67_9TREE|nr:hypothetical protein QFC22_000005 [Naganishia vaughanmartiniae]